MKTKPEPYNPVSVPEEWEPAAPTIIQRPLIKIDFSSTAARTFGRFLIVSCIAVAVVSVAYLFINGLSSAPGNVGVKMVETIVRDEWGDPLTLNIPLLIGMGAAWIGIMSIWWFNRGK